MVVFQEKLIKSTITFILLSFAFIACKDDKCIKAPDISSVEISVNIERLDRKLNKISTKSALSEILVQNPMFAEGFLNISHYPDPENLLTQYYDLLNNASVDSLFIEVENTFGDLEEIRLQFEEAFRYLKYYYPETKVPKIKTVVTGLIGDLYLSDSLIIIGLDYYLGFKGKYLPKDIPGYILKRYQKEYMVPQIMLMYSNLYNKTNQKDGSAVADMVYYGKAYYMAKNLMPCSPDSLFTGYSAFETNDIDEHEPVIWASVLENELLFETNPYIKDKFLSERPKTIEIGENCPGRIGRWIGWRIVRKYAKQHPEISVPEMMAMDDAQKIFIESKYKPIPY
jgi:gliding motility-associated lipoprotein GldB